MMRPVVEVMADVFLKAGLGHTFVVKGFDPARILSVVDPAQPPPGLRC